jgi:hypothetical protein
MTGCTLTTIQPYHNPNEGRDIINANFECLQTTVDSIQVAASTGNTIISASTNINSSLSYSGVVPVYTISTTDSPEFTNVSADTIYLNSVDISTLLGGGDSYGSQVNVIFSGTNSYSGSSIPTTTGYSTSTIFLSQFLNTNSSTAITISIDGVATYDLLKGTEDGLSPLEINEIQTGVTYFLTFDDTQFQFFTSSPSGTTGTYTNLSPTTTTIGGLPAGTTFSGTTWQEIFNVMFYPTLVPNFTSFAMRSYPSTATTQTQTLEVGDTVTGGTRVFTWATSNSSFVSPNTIKIYNVTGGNVIVSTPSTGISNDGVESIVGLTNVQKVTPSSHIWKIFGTRTNSTTFNTSFTVTWYWRRMYGVSTATTITTSSEVNAFSGQSALTNTIAGTYSFSGSGYKYFFVPTTFSSPSLFKDQSTQLSVSMADSSDDSFYSGSSGSYSFGTTSVTNQYGISQNYRIYRTRNYLNGDIIITVT